MNASSNSSLPGTGSNHTATLIPYLDVELPVTFALKIVLDIVGAVANFCLLMVCYLKHKTDPNAVNFIIMQLVSCWLVLDLVIFPINDVITFLYIFDYHVCNNQRFGETPGTSKCTTSRHIEL